jgi:pyrroline-5-carboxylate reductase
MLAYTGRMAQDIDSAPSERDGSSAGGPVAFIGGGNMAQALIGGLMRGGVPAGSILVVEPWAEQREKLRAQFGLAPLEAADPRLAAAGLVVWAVKPQTFATAAPACAPFVSRAVQLSVMAGVRCAAIERATGSDRIVRAMPNTPALIGQGIAGLYASPAVEAGARERVAALFAPTGQVLWVAEEAELDAVTALSGSGPACVFYFLEAMQQAAVEMGLAAEQGRALAQAKFAGAAALAAASPLSPQELRAQVTSPGGTTQAAIAAMEDAGMKPALVRALHAARERARQLGAGS